MTKITKQVIQEITISLDANTATPDTKFIMAISAITGNFNLVLQVSPEDVVRSTGMVAIPAGVITIGDVSRVLEAATSLVCNDDTVMQASPTCNFVIDGKIRTKFIPIGIPAKRLDVTVSLVRINNKTLQRWSDLASKSGRNIVGWRIEELHAN